MSISIYDNSLFGPSIINDSSKCFETVILAARYYQVNPVDLFRKIYENDHNVLPQLNSYGLRFQKEVESGDKYFAILGNLRTDEDHNKNNVWTTIEDIAGRKWPTAKDCARDLAVDKDNLIQKLNYKSFDILPGLNYLDLHILCDRPKDYKFLPLNVAKTNYENGEGYKKQFISKYVHEQLLPNIKDSAIFRVEKLKTESQIFLFPTELSSIEFYVHLANLMKEGTLKGLEYVTTKTYVDPRNKITKEFYTECLGKHFDVKIMFGKNFKENYPKIFKTNLEKALKNEN